MYYYIKMDNHNSDETVTVRVFDDLGAATTALNKLKEQGIDSFIHDANVMGLDPVAGIELKIFLKDLEKANVLLG